MLSQLKNSKLGWITEVNRPSKCLDIHHLKKTIDQVIDKTKGACLTPLPIHGNVFTAKRLYNEI